MLTVQDSNKELLEDKGRFKVALDNLIKKHQKEFYRFTFYHFLFYALFSSLFLLEATLLLAFYQSLGKSTVFAATLALIFLSLFSFFIFRLYIQASRPTLLRQIRERFTEGCKEMMGFEDHTADHHLALAGALTKFASNLEGGEYTFFKLPATLETVRSSIEKLSCYIHWFDFHLVKEAFLQKAVEEHILLVKLEPTNLEVHASLANAYVTLSSLYADPRTKEGFDEEKWIPQKRLNPVMEESFRKTAQKAIEEFKILNDFAPSDPWIHIQLAYSYHDLGMPEKEIHEYETILKLRPGDKEILFKLGILYFQQGQNAKGLHIYDTLKRNAFQKAEDLIKFYGSYSGMEPTPIL